MRILVVEPERRPVLREIDGSLESMQEIVGGLIQPIYPFDDPVALVCNDEGRTAAAPIIERSRKSSVLTKQGLRVQLQQGQMLNDLLVFGPGQDCEIFKADKFYPGDVVIYVPDVSLNHIPIDRPITEPEEFVEVLSNCYTGQDFIDECGGDVEKAKCLFCYCDWQHPSSAIDEIADDEEES